MRLTMLLKLSFWRQLPWILFGLGHHVVNKAIECGRRALALYHNAADDVKQLFIVNELCCPGFTGYEQLVLLTTKQRGMQDLPVLEFAAARFYFASVTERWIESLHAIMKKYIKLACNFTAVSCVFHTVLVPLARWFRHSPDEVGLFARHCSDLRTAFNAIKEMGLLHHPVVQQLLLATPQLKDMNRKHRPKLVEILFHVDNESIIRTIEDEDEDAGGQPPPQGPPPQWRKYTDSLPKVPPPDAGEGPSGSGSTASGGPSITYPGTASVSSGTAAVSSGVAAVPCGVASVAAGLEPVSSGSATISLGTLSVSSGTAAVSSGTTAVSSAKSVGDAHHYDFLYRKYILEYVEVPPVL